MMREVPGELELMAYADGELDAGALERVRQYVAENPSAAGKVNLHRKLRETGRRVMAGTAVPAGLLGRIEGLVDEAASAPMRPQRGWRIGGWAMAAAAVLVVGIGSVVIWSTLGGRGVEVVRGSDLVPVGWVESASKVHIECSKHAAHFAPPFARVLTELPESLRGYLGQTAQCPDLSRMGYQFAGCGPCRIPGGKTAHLLYRPADGQGRGTLSLFVQRDEGQLKVDGGKVYLSRDASDGTEMIVWREGGVVYYLVGENDGQLRSAAGAMGMRVRI